MPENGRTHFYQLLSPATIFSAEATALQAEPFPSADLHVDIRCLYSVFWILCLIATVLAHRVKKQIASGMLAINWQATSVDFMLVTSPELTKAVLSSLVLGNPWIRVQNSRTQGSTYRVAFRTNPRSHFSVAVDLS